MSRTPSRPESTLTAPPAFRDASAELVQMGLRVARMVAQSADVETELAQAAARAGAAAGASALATSLAEAIEADRAAAAAAEARQTIIARTEAIARAFARVARAIRLTILLAERMDRGWARGNTADDRHAMARRQIARGVADAIAREAEGERAVTLTAALRERLDSLDTESAFADHSAEDMISIISRDLGLDPARMTRHSLAPAAISPAGACTTAPRARTSQACRLTRRSAGQMAESGPC